MSLNMIDNIRTEGVDAMAPKERAERSPDRRRRVFWRNTTIVVISLALSVVGAKLAPIWLLAASLTVIAGTLLTIAASFATVPAPYRHLRKRMAQAYSIAVMHPILKRHFEDGLTDTAHTLDSIIAGRFNFHVSEVPELSVHAMNLVDKECVLVFPLSNSEALLTPDSGTAAEYYRAMVAASKRMQQADRDGVVRIFLLRRDEDVSPRLLQFMRRNVEDGIQVRVIFEENLPPKPLDVDEMDFGYYAMAEGYKWIMLLRSVDSSAAAHIVDYDVDTDPRKVDEYRRYSTDIKTHSMSFQDFTAILASPVNGDLWPAYFAQRGFEMTPPHGLSDEDATYIVESVMKTIPNPTDASILVLGFTPKLIRHLLEQDVGSVHSVDQFGSKPPQFTSKVHYHTANWLNMTLPQSYDAIVFDEAINNLSRLQLSLFFPRVREFMKPNAHIVGRIMGRFDDEVSRFYLERTTWQVVEELRSISSTSHDDVAPLIICLLHSHHMAFTPPTMRVDCAAWNTTLKTLRHEGRLSDDEFRMWKLPFQFVLLSPDLETLIKEAKQSYFNPFEVTMVHGPYASTCKHTASFYRIVDFEYIPPTCDEAR